MAMENGSHSPIRFGDFTLDVARRSLVKNGESIVLKAKSFDLLVMLVENRGSIVSKDQLLETVWEGQFVEENNLTVNMSALRKALGESKGNHLFIATIPGKGYKFVGEIIPDEPDLIIETRKIERITIDEEVQISPAEGARWPVISPVYALAAVAIVGICIVAVIGGAAALRDRFSAAKPASSGFSEYRTRQLTTNGKVGSAALSLDGKLFVYTVLDLEKQSLWLGYTNGGEPIKLRDNAPISYRDLAFSADGSTIFYSAVDDANSKGAIFRLPVSGGSELKIVDGKRQFEMSPDGKRFVFATRDRETGFFAFSTSDTDGNDLREIGSLTNRDRVYSGSVSMSRDGKRLAFGLAAEGSGQYDKLGILDLTNNSLKEISPKNAREFTKTAWLDDGKSLIVTAIETEVHASVPRYSLWEVNLDTAETVLITPDRSNYGASWHNDSGVSLGISKLNDLLLSVEHRQTTNVWVAPSDNLFSSRQITAGSFGKNDGLWGLDWTPDGRLIYTTSDSRTQYIASMNADGSDQKAITKPTGVDSQLVVSGDGKYVFFHSNRTSELDIWRVDIDGSNLKQLSFGGFGFHPAPSPDGKWVYYKSQHRKLGELCRVPIDGGERECFTEDQVFYPTFSPDGNYLATGLRTDQTRLAILSATTHEVIRQFDLPLSRTLYVGFRWTPDSKAVVYRDKTNGYWKQPIDGSKALRLEGLPNDKLYNFAYSMDGTQFAYVRGEEIRDIVLLQR